ncbi:hypothetical protein [Chroococcidiopsis sp. CCMEE 29]|uniref:hypothetical protein n=1 Tax=Chroococcidiopsis sp. CCMEE 29 TaxID=155894 RepID=UPI00202071B1|nr:hypothetical protein [Chroococcidiopsis sp. CCMEE 29]
MIDRQVFEQEIAILMDWFNRDFEPKTLKRLHQRLSAHLSTKQFVQAALIVFDESHFFPTVEEFVSAVKGDAETLALQEWDLCVKAAARTDKGMLSGLSSQGQSALHLVGGLHKLGMATEDDLRWLKKEFVAMCKSTPADEKSLPQSRASEYEQLDVVRSLSGKLSFNGKGR